MALEASLLLQAFATRPGGFSRVRREFVWIRGAESKKVWWWHDDGWHDVDGQQPQPLCSEETIGDGDGDGDGFDDNILRCQHGQKTKHTKETGVSWQGTKERPFDRSFWDEKAKQQQ